MCVELGEEGIVDGRRPPSSPALSFGCSRAVRGLCVCVGGGGGGRLYKVRSNHHGPLLSRGSSNEVFMVSVDVNHHEKRKKLEEQVKLLNVGQ